MVERGLSANEYAMETKMAELRIARKPNTAGFEPFFTTFPFVTFFPVDDVTFPFYVNASGVSMSVTYRMVIPNVPFEYKLLLLLSLPKLRNLFIILSDTRFVTG